MTRITIHAHGDGGWIVIRQGKIQQGAIMRPVQAQRFRSRAAALLAIGTFMDELTT